MIVASRTPAAPLAVVRSTLAVAFSSVSLLLCCQTVGGAQASQKRAAPAADSLFGLTNVSTIDLKVSPEDWKKMEPEMPAGGRFPAGQRNGPGATPPPRMHIDFQYVPASLEFEGRTYEKIALRFKGNSSYRSSSRSLKRPFKIDFNKYVRGQKFYGLTKLVLNNNTFDASQLREALAYEIFRDVGVAAPRTAFSKVYLTVPGEFNREFLGLYTLVESVDERFLKDRFGAKDVLLLKPTLRQGLAYFGESWDGYKGPYAPKVEVKDADATWFMAFAKLVDQSDEATFREQIAKYLDVDQFLGFLAVQTATANLDSVLSMGHNYYLYRNSATGKLNWIPWDLNEAFGRFRMVGSEEQQINLSIDHPYVGENRLIQRLLAIPEYRTNYRHHLEKLAALFASGKLQKQIQTAAPLIRAALNGDPEVSVAAFERSTFGVNSQEIADPRPTNRDGDPNVGLAGPGFGGGGRGFRPDNGPSLTAWIEGRAASLSEQLQGKRDGYVPERRMRGPGPERRARGGSPGAFPPRPPD